MPWQDHLPPSLRRCLVGLALLLTGCLDPTISGTTSGDGTETAADAGSSGGDVSDASTGTSEASPDTGTTTPVTMADGTTAAEPEITTTTDMMLHDCGDGIVEGDEECDDGNEDPDDGCWQCAHDRVMFVTSKVYQGHKLQGLLGADARCRMLAALAGLNNHVNYRAWLSTATASAASRLHHSPGRYLLANGTPVAYGWHDLVSGDLRTAINIDENSQAHGHSSVWTGTLADGSPALGSDFCNDWDHHDSQFLFGGSGSTTDHDNRWSFVAQEDCGGESSLYCVEN